MAGDTHTKAVAGEEMRQLNVLIPREKVEELHRLKAVCGTPLVGLVEACIDLFSLAHRTEAEGGKVLIVSADGSDRLEVQLPRGGIHTVPVRPWRAPLDG